MDTEQSAPDSDAILSRMTAALAPEGEDEQPAEPTQAVEEQPTEGEAPQEDSQDVEATDTADEFAEIEDDTGVTHKVPAALKDAFLRRQDYTRKTMAAAEQTRLANDRIQYAEAREQVTGALIQDIVEYKSLQSQLEQVNAIDVAEAYRIDPGQAMQIMDRRARLERQIADLGSNIKTKAQQAEQMTQAHRGNQWKIAVEGVKSRIGTFTPGEDAAMAKQVQELGFDKSELESRFADPRFLHLVYKAAKWDALQSQKPAAVAKASSAPPVVKPGASRGAAVAAEQRYRDARAKLSKSGDVNDAARLFLLRG